MGESIEDIIEEIGATDIKCSFSTDERWFPNKNL